VPPAVASQPSALAALEFQLESIPLRRLLMRIILTLALPREALDRLMDHYRSGDPELMEMLREFRVLAIRPQDDDELSVWENEGGK
jgi:hypothetical protein